jgi:hypothetical protein
MYELQEGLIKVDFHILKKRYALCAMRFATPARSLAVKS